MTNPYESPSSKQRDSFSGRSQIESTDAGSLLLVLPLTFVVIFFLLFAVPRSTVNVWEYVYVWDFVYMVALSYVLIGIYLAATDRRQRALVPAFIGIGIWPIAAMICLWEFGNLGYLFSFQHRWVPFFLLAMFVISIVLTIRKRMSRSESNA